LFSFLGVLLHLLSCQLVDDSWQKFSSFTSFGFGILKVSSRGEEVLEYEFAIEKFPIIEFGALL
jgi:hypothetical protein